MAEMRVPEMAKFSHGARGVHAPIGGGGNLLLAEEIVFGPEIGAHTVPRLKKKHAPGACR